MDELNSIQDVIDYLKGSTLFWAIGVVACAVAAAALLFGGRR